MMIGEAHRHNHLVPPWQEPLNPTVQISSPSSSPPQSNSLAHAHAHAHAPQSPTYYDAVLASLRRYLLSPATENEPSSPVGDYAGEVDLPVGEYDDEFFMYDFKVRKCTRARAHDWTECPFAHPGEKARRRDPRKYNYSGTACSDFRKGHCRKGDGCEFAHGVFECWLHPSRFRTQACKDGPGCKRRVCFFAHAPDQLRAASGLSSPRSPDGLGDLAASLRNLQLNKVKSMPAASWGVQVGGSVSPVYGSPRGVGSGFGSAMSRAGFFSLPTTPTRPGVGLWDNVTELDQDGEPVMERVESGRQLRVRMFEKLSKENPLNGSGLISDTGPGPGPDLGWVSDLIE